MTSQHYCFFQDQIIPVKQARISPYDLGILRGYTVFDYLRTYGGKPFMFTEHLARFRDGASKFHLSIPLRDEEIHDAMHSLMAKNGLKEAGIRLVVTGGHSSDTKHVGTPTFYILTDPVEELPHEIFEKGVRIVTIEHEREYPSTKNSSYVTAIKEKIEREDEDIFEVLYVSDGIISEASTSNIFAVTGGKLITPKDDILYGITRKVVIDIAREKGMTVEERDVTLDELLKADEVFLTATSKFVLPVIIIDATTIGDGKPGPISKRLLQLFIEKTAR